MAQRIRSLVRVAPWIVVLLGALGPWEVQGAPPAPEGLVIRLESGHPWRPPFGLDRVGQPFTAVIESSEPPRHSGYLLTVLHQGKDVGRHPVNFTTKPPCSATITIAEYGDEVVLSAGKANEAGRIDLARQPIRIPRIEMDAVARPESVTNPVDLGTILVPHGWLLLGPGQSGVLDLAAICREKDEPQAHVRAWFGSASGRAVTALLPLQEGQKQRLSLKLPEPSKTFDRDVLRVALVDGRGKVLGQKSIPVMLVQKPPRWPRFGATYTKSPRWAKVSWRPIVFSVANARGLLIRPGDLTLQSGGLALGRGLEGLDANYVEQVHLDRALEERLSGLACQSDHGNPSSDPEQVRVADIQANPVRYHQTKRLERLLAEKVSEVLGGHRSDSIVEFGRTNSPPFRTLVWSVANFVPG